MVIHYMIVILFKQLRDETKAKGKEEKNKEEKMIYDRSQNIWEKLLFSCVISHYGESSIYIFQNTFTSPYKF